MVAPALGSILRTFSDEIPRSTTIAEAPKFCQRLLSNDKLRMKAVDFLLLIDELKAEDETLPMECSGSGHRALDPLGAGQRYSVTVTVQIRNSGVREGIFEYEEANIK